MSIESTENDKMLRPDLKKTVKMFYGYAAAWLLKKDLLSLHDINMPIKSLFQDLCTMLGKDDILQLFAMVFKVITH